MFKQINWVVLAVNHSLNSLTCANSNYWVSQALHSSLIETIVAILQQQNSTTLQSMMMDDDDNKYYVDFFLSPDDFYRVKINLIYK